MKRNFDAEKIEFRKGRIMKTRAKIETAAKNVKQ